jgi:trigger factor
VDFEGRLEGTPFEGGTAQDFSFELGAGRMLPEFEAAVTGLKVGESKVFPLTFPADYAAQNLAGKTVEFTVTLKKLEAPVLPAVDAEFAKSLGIESGDVDALRADIRRNLEREVENRVMARTKASVMDALVAAAGFELPKALVEDDVQSMIQRAREDLKQRGVPNAADMPIPAEAFTEQSERRVRLGLLVAELVKAEGLQAKPDQVRAKIESFASAYEQPNDVVRWYLSDRNRVAEIEALVLEDNVVAHVLGRAKVAEKAVSFDELMGQG